MTLFKKGTVDSSIIVSSSVYSCSSCEHTEAVVGDLISGKKCSVCGGSMTVISSQTEESQGFSEIE